MSTFKQIITLIILLILLGLAYSFLKPSSNIPVIPGNLGGDAIVCTMDAMMCPDGKYVGRTGPNCEFVCSTSATSTPGAGSETSLYEEFTVGLNEPKKISDTTITALAVTEDSRCPSDVVCIQAGRTVVELRLVTPSGSSIIKIEVGKTVTTETLSITLDEVAPYPISSKKTRYDEYRFKFNVKGK